MRTGSSWDHVLGGGGVPWGNKSACGGRGGGVVRTLKATHVIWLTCPSPLALAKPPQGLDKGLALRAF